MTKEELEQYARENRKRLDAQEVKLGDVVKVLVGHFAGEKGVIVGMIACDKSDYADPYYEIEMECDVPEEFRVRKTLIGQSRVIGGVERRYLKVIGNRAPKQPSNEIKVGDKVRVLRDMPQFYLEYNSYRMFEIQHRVMDVNMEDGFALLDSIPSKFTTILPTKYLAKVDAEAKEPKYKYQVGQKVKSAYANEILTIKERCGRVSHDNVYKVEEYAYTWNECELQPYTEPTEQTEVEKNDSDVPFSIFRDDLLSNPQIVNLHNGMHYRQCYEAELAKEIAVKVANKFNAPEEAAEYAVSVAKAVAENLKNNKI